MPLDVLNWTRSKSMHKLIWGRLKHGLLLITEANSKYSIAVESNKAQLLVDHNFPLCYLEVYLLPTLSSFSHKTKAWLASAQ